MLVASPLTAQNLQQGFEPAVLPTQALPAAVGSAGEIWLKGMRLRTPLIAEQPIRVVRGIVRTDGRETSSVLPLVVLGETSPGEGIPKHSSAQAWCDVMRGGGRFACYQDIDGDGKLETGRLAIALNFGEPLTIAAVGPASKRPLPIGYRPASDAELLSAGV
jgi:hypothetical protein